MHEDVGAAPVELGEHRIPGRIAEVGPAHVRQQHHAVEREPVERVSDLLERAVDVGQRQQREAGEAVGRAAHHVGDPLVPDPRELSRTAGVAEERARRAGGDHRRVDLVALHHRLEALERRGQHRHAAERLDVGRRQHVRVGVDAGHPRRAYSGAIAAIVTSKRFALGSIGKEWSCSQAPMASEPSTMKRQRS